MGACCASSREEFPSCSSSAVAEYADPELPTSANVELLKSAHGKKLKKLPSTSLVAGNPVQQSRDSMDYPKTARVASLRNVSAGNKKRMTSEGFHEATDQEGSAAPVITIAEPETAVGTYRSKQLVPKQRQMPIPSDGDSSNESEVDAGRDPRPAAADLLKESSSSEDLQKENQVPVFHAANAECRASTKSFLGAVSAPMHIVRASLCETDHLDIAGTASEVRRSSLDDMMEADWSSLGAADAPHSLGTKLTTLAIPAAQKIEEESAEEEYEF